jgi:hypothetical protein
VVWYWGQEAYGAWRQGGMLIQLGRLDAAEGRFRHAAALHEQVLANFQDQMEYTNNLRAVRRDLANLLAAEGKRAPQTSQLGLKPHAEQNKAGKPSLGWFASTRVGFDPPCNLPEPASWSVIEAESFVVMAFATSACTNSSSDKPIGSETARRTKQSRQAVARQIRNCQPNGLRS